MVISLVGGSLFFIRNKNVKFLQVIKKRKRKNTKAWSKGFSLETRGRGRAAVLTSHSHTGVEGPFNPLPPPRYLAPRLLAVRRAASSLTMLL